MQIRSLDHGHSATTRQLRRLDSSDDSAGKSLGSNASKQQEINAGIDATLARTYAEVPGSRGLMARAQGILVFPKVLQGGRTLGGEYGVGALRVGGSTRDYYNLVLVLPDIQAGVESTAVVFLFMTEHALNTFESRQGWLVSGDTSVEMLKMGANGTIGTLAKPVGVIVLTNAGLMVNLSPQGMKISPVSI
ncbi:YSC84-related protein [Paraburkholderia nemoris]|uniref:lipid-binding SYLF domain-containing protein n=1 Tax=Paraburkholderia nemoris TaxID=2793076 RepID=UPI0038BE121A